MRKLSAVLLIVVAAATARAEWTINSAESEPSIASGVEHRHLVLKNSVTDDRAAIELAFFSTARAILRVIDQPDGARDLAKVMQREKCLAGVNGGYFDPNFTPIGLLISDGKTIAPLQHARLLTGLLVAGSHGVELLRISEFSQLRKLDAAVECGPFLVDRGVGVRGLDETRPARRTFAAVDRSGHAALGFCSEVSLAQLAEILSTLQLNDGFKIWRAMNLDGGSSSAFWFKHKDGEAFSISEQKNVRDFIAVVAK